MVIVITGPTAVGKTKMSIELAKYIQGEIINADSTQVYRDLNIATAKMKEEEKEGIPHHLFDMISIEEDYNVFAYQKDCRKKIEEILSRNHVPILVGGTGLYIKAALYDYQFEEEAQKREYSESTETLYQKLKQIDSKTEIHPHNRKRIIRALEHYQQTGKIQKKKTNTLLYPTIMIGLTTDKKQLYERINHRVDDMVKEGLLEEAKKLYYSHIRTKAVMTPIGYKELFPYFEGTCKLEDALNQVKQNSRHYAKRQYTWFRNQMPITWVTVDFDHFENTIYCVRHLLTQEGIIKNTK